MNTEFYNGLLERLGKDVRRKRSEKWKNEFVLHHDKARSHTALVISHFWLIKCVIIDSTRQTWHNVVSLYSQKLIHDERKPFYYDARDRNCNERAFEDVSEGWLEFLQKLAGPSKQAVTKTTQVQN